MLSDFHSEGKIQFQSHHEGRQPDVSRLNSWGGGGAGDIREENASSPHLPPATAYEVITWDNSADFREDGLYGLAEQLVAQGLRIRGADGKGVNSSQHVELNPVVSHNVLDEV